MAAPGSLTARYEVLAGPPERRREYYYAVSRLRYKLSEWLEAPWWHRRLLLEQMALEAEEQRQERDGDGGQDMGMLDALYGGSAADVAASTGFTVG